jgi:hypothetical protein
VKKLSIHFRIDYEAVVSSGGSGRSSSGGGSGEVLVFNIRNEVKNEVRK